MAKIYLDRIQKKYGWTGGKYEQLMGKIIAQNSTNISHNVARISQTSFEKENIKLRKKGRGKEKLFVLPDVKDIIPRKEFALLKGADKGKLMTDNIREKLTQNLRNTIKDPKYKTRTGVRAGLIKQDMIKDFEKTITKTFTNYTKRDPKYGVPSNIHTIANEEIRATMSQINDDYMGKFLQLNDDTEARKRWIHNTRMVKVPRKPHVALHRVTIPYNEYFEIKSDRVYLCRYPHDPNLPIGEKAGCNCEIQYLLIRKAK